MQDSTYQEAIYSHVSEGGSHLLIDALAGSGKTTTIVKVASILPKGKSILFMAFNKAIQLVIRDRVPDHVDVKTCHAYGFGILNANLTPRPRLAKGSKMRNIVKSLMPTKEEVSQATGKAHYEVATDLVKMAELAKGYLCTKSSDLQDILECHDMTPFWGWEELDTIVLPAIEESMSDSREIDYSDMIYMPIHMNLFGKTYDYVIVDEFQDFNNAMERLLLRAVRPNGTIIAVGDNNQAIYAFRGSVAGIMDKFAGKKQAKVLPLPICYRCPESHIALAQQIVPAIQPFKKDKGVIKAVGMQSFSELVKPGDLVMCRTTAPLVDLCLTLIAKYNVKAVVAGKDMMEQIKAFIQSFKMDDCHTLLQMMRETSAKKCNRWKKQEKFHLIQMQDDKDEAVSVLLENSDTVSEAIEKLESIFAEDREAVSLSTIHRAKGQESRNVWIISGNKIPHPMGLKSRINQEKNIEFIAYTRSTENLYFVSPMPEDPTPVQSWNKANSSKHEMTSLQATACGLLAHTKGIQLLDKPPTKEERVEHREDSDPPKPASPVAIHKKPLTAREIVRRALRKTRAR